jgi:hypothetical protein
VFTAINGTGDHEMEEDCAELLAYEEFHDRNPLPPNYKKRMRMLMHYDVSTNPFFASVRLHSHSRGQTPLRTRANTAWSEAGSTTPGSIPPTPKTRALCLTKSYDKVNNVLFTARDVLRAEVRRSTSDEITKRSASKLLDKAKFGTYDPYHTAQNIRLSDGNHCARRVSLVNRTSPSAEAGSTSHPMNSISSCSTRSSLVVMRNAYVYFEYFIKSNRSPSMTMTQNQPKSFSTPSSQPPLGQIDSQPTDDVRNSPPSPLPIPSIHSPTRRYHGDAPAVYLGIASCDFPLHGGVPVGLSDKSLSISPNGYVNISSGSTQLIDDSEHGSNPLDYNFVKSYPIQAQVSSGDRIGMLLYLSSPTSEEDHIFTPMPNQRYDGGESQPENHQTDQSLRLSRSSGSWSSLGLSVNQAVPMNEAIADAIHEGETFEININLNGYPIELPWDAQAQLADIAWGGNSLYPTVSFMDCRTSVWSGFSVDDVVHRDRKSIGAPPGVVVYCLDGSVLLGQDE